MSYHLRKATLRLCSFRNNQPLLLLNKNPSLLQTRHASDVPAVTPVQVVAPSVEVVAPPVEVVAPPVEVIEAVSQVVVDPPFAELGLGTGWMPYNLIELGFEKLHLALDLPWWGTITVGAIIVRTLTLPLFINSKKYNIRMSNESATTSKLMSALTEANASGDFMQRALASQRYFGHMRETRTGIPYAYPTLLMAGIFTSCFFALRHMCNVPLPTLEASSFLWLDSLVSNDPYRLLPLTTGAVVGVGIHYGLKFGSPIPPTYQRFVKYVPIAPVVLIPLLAGHMSGAVQIYMIVNSAITAGGSVALMMPEIQRKLDFPLRKPPIIDITPVSQQLAARQQKSKTGNWFKDQLAENKSRARAKVEAKENRRKEKAELKRRAKELKAKSPPVTYEIGTEAVLAATSLPDFETYGKAKVRQLKDYDYENKTKFRTIRIDGGMEKFQY